MGFPKIKKFLREAIHYPSKKVMYVEMIGVENSKFYYHEAFFGKDEAELIKYIKFNLKDKLTTKEVDRLWDLIETYGSEKYEDGQDDVHMQNAGADL